MQLKIFLIIWIISMTLLGCSNKNNSKESNNSKEIALHQINTNKKQNKMKITVFSNYGSEKKVVSDSATVDQVIETMNSLNWNKFLQVTLEKINGDWIEVSGNLKEDGLSVMYEENGKQYIIDEPPISVDQMTKILLSYLAGDGMFKIENKFE